MGLSSDKVDESLEVKIGDITKQIIDLQDQKSIQLRNLGRKEVSSELNITSEVLEKEVFSIKEKLQSLLDFPNLDKVKEEIKKIVQNINTLFNSKNEEKG